MISKNSLKKEFYIQEFLKRFNLSNKKQTQIKQMIIEAISEQIKSQLIQPQFKIIQEDGSIRKINKLQPQDITQKLVKCDGNFSNLKPTHFRLYFGALFKQSRYDGEYVQLN